MSLINKMLQDLDARGSQAGSALQSEIKPVMMTERRLPLMQIMLGVTVVVIAMAIAAFFWLKGRAPGAVSNAPAVLISAPPAPVAAPVVARQVPHVPQAAVAPAAPPAAAVAVVPPAAPIAPAPPAVAAKPAAPAPVAVREPSPARVAPAVPAEPAAPAVRVVDAARIAQVQPPAAPVVGGRETTTAQRAEGQYRQAIAALDEGRVPSAIDGLEAALKLNPRHDAARQSLVGLLIEAGRNDQAMQQLEQGLAADPAQPTLAMLLARMQIERGTSGVATLLRTLPSAQANADYHAFLAGALQREGRHREAVEQYQAALRRMPGQGIWLMGLGISLQAEKRNADALGAFQQAKTSGMLTPALMSFVEGKIQQLQ